jgi:hypothetical protein
MFADPFAMQLLARDLERIAQSNGPSSSDLRDAPVLNDWHVMLCQVPVLVGNVVGHPDRPNGAIVTSQLYALDYDSRAWARTMNRWYQLRDRKLGAGG